MPAQITFDHYELLTRSDGSPFELGRGAMGITYKAFDTNLRIPVALKVINGPGLQNELARSRFVQEARAAARLRHRHVASVFHLGVEGENYFYAMEFIDGETVECLVKRHGPLPELVALRITLQVSRALHAAEQHGLVHRDIKPSNLMLVHEDEGLCAKVIDFGLAKSRVADEEGATSSASTTSQGFLGTPHYASPEQLEEGEVDGRSDLYSLGATLWYMLTGEPPFTGSVARVVSQHLGTPPPLERLDGTSPAIIELLGRMLQKDPIARPQTATEVRRAIEQCLEAAAGGPAAAAARLALEEAQLVAPTTDEKATGEFTQGTVVAERYEILAALGATNTGWLYRARDLSTGHEVRLVLLDQSFSEDRAVLTSLEEEIVTLQAVEHPNLLKVQGLELIGARVMLVLEWTNGVTLLQVLRTRRELQADEVLRLLEPMAAGADEAAELSLKRLELSLHQVYLHFPGFTGDEEGLLRKSLDKWPEWVLKLNPIALTREISQSQTWAGGQTLAGGAAALGASAAEGERSYTRELAVLVYELLGGTMTPIVAAKAGAQGVVRFSPLSNLTEQGNSVLRKALDPASPFPRAADFYRSLIDVGALEAQYADNPAATHVPGDTGPEAIGKSRAGGPPGKAGGEKPKKSGPLVPTLAVAAVLVVAAIAYLLFGRGKTPTLTESQPPDQDTPQATTPTATPPESVPSTPRAITPTPDERATLLEAMANAEQIEAKGDPKDALAAWLKVLRDFPKEAIGKTRLDVLLTSLAERPNPARDPKLLALQPLIREAAELDVVSAQMLLGEMLRQSNAKESFTWYSRAAARGVPTAMTQVGLMLSNGAGVDRDLTKAFQTFQAAAEKGDAGAYGALGECYLNGYGVEKDSAKAIPLLEKAASKSNVRAMNRLGDCYHSGIGVQVNFEEARRYFKKAADLGLPIAIGNLGILYLMGEGGPKDSKKALEYIQRAATLGDGHSMFVFAACLDEGTWMAPNPGEAKQWYIKAARAGDRKGIAWCHEHYPDFAEIKWQFGGETLRLDDLGEVNRILGEDDTPLYTFAAGESPKGWAISKGGTCLLLKVISQRPPKSGPKTRPSDYVCLVRLLRDAAGHPSSQRLLEGTSTAMKKPARFVEEVRTVADDGKTALLRIGEENQSGAVTFDWQLWDLEAAKILQANADPASLVQAFFSAFSHLAWVGAALKN